MKIKSFRFTLVLAALTCLLFTDCRREPKVEEVEEVVYKRMVNEVIASDALEADNLNMVYTTNSASFYALYHLFQSLQQINPVTIALEPVLAKARPSIEERGEQVAYTFEIREEAVWPNGTPITADDVAFSMKLF